MTLSLLSGCPPDKRSFTTDISSLRLQECYSAVSRHKGEWKCLVALYVVSPQVLGCSLGLIR